MAERPTKVTPNEDKEKEKADESEAVEMLFEVLKGKDTDNKDDDKYSKRTRAVRKLDFFNKIEVDHIVRTERGGQLTAVGYVIMLVLILAEYFTWRGMNGESIEHVVVDTRYVFNLSFRCIVTFHSGSANEEKLPPRW